MSIVDGSTIIVVKARMSKTDAASIWIICPVQKVLVAITDRAGISVTQTTE